MKKRNLFAVFILPFVTFGVYGLVWLVKTKDEMNRQGANIPTAWLLIVPFANFYWSYKYAEGVERVTGAKMSTIVAFLLEIFLGVIGNVILQSEFNKLADVAQPIAANTATPVVDSVNTAPITPTTPIVPVAPSMPAGQYQANTPAPEATINPQPTTSPIAPEDNSQTPPTPNQF